MGIEGLREPVLVTGATGFIGQRLVSRLLDENVNVHASSSSENGLMIPSFMVELHRQLYVFSLSQECQEH